MSFSTYGIPLALAGTLRGLVAGAAPLGAVDDDDGAQLLAFDGVAPCSRCLRSAAGLPAEGRRRSGARQGRPGLLAASHGDRLEVRARHGAHRIGPADAGLAQIDHDDLVRVRALVAARIGDAHRVSAHQGHVGRLRLDVEVALVVDPREQQSVAVVSHDHRSPRDRRVDAPAALPRLHAPSASAGHDEHDRHEAARPSLHLLRQARPLHQHRIDLLRQRLLVASHLRQLLPVFARARLQLATEKLEILLPRGDGRLELLDAPPLLLDGPGRICR